jgi:mRNA-degrading endonuclease RelE of RelBE toxin-antitoxin system
MEYKVEFKPDADKDLERMNKELIFKFLKSSRKLKINPSKKHMKFGLPFFIQKVTKQARLIFKIENNMIYILRCFKNHKEYEKYYKSFK